MPKDKGDEWKHVTVVTKTTGSGGAGSHPQVKCLYCNKVFVGNAVRIRSHLSGVGEKGSDIAKCSDVPEGVVHFFQQQDERRYEVAEKKKKTQELNRATTSGLLPIDKNFATVAAAKTQTKIPGLYASQQGGKEVADKAIARFFYANAIAFNAAESRYFKEAVKAIAACGPSYVPPGRKPLGGTLLDKELADVQAKTSQLMKNCASQGVTLVSDGWTSVTNRPIINFLVVSSEGATFLSSVDTSGNDKSADYIADLIVERVVEVGQDRIVQVVMDSAASCVAAGKLVMKKYPSIVCSPCTAHCIDLLLEDIGKQQWISNIIQQGHDIVKFVTNHHTSLAYFRSHASLELLKPGETRFATNFIMLQRLMQCKDDLQETVVSKEYKQWVSKPKYVKLGLQLSTVILSQTFWDNVKKVVDLCIPVVDVLRLADGHVPCTGKIYWKMFQAHKSIEESVELGDNDRNLLASLIM